MDNHIFEQIALYLDDELQEPERLAVESHTRSCAECRAALHAEREWIAALRKARPKHQAPPSLRGNIERLVLGAASHRERIPLRPALALCALLLFAIGILWFAPGNPLREDRGSFVNVAVSHHVRYLQGQLPLEVFSDSPETISAWFTGKLTFNLKLPDYPQRAAEPKPYHVEGARLIGFAGDYAAYVVYRLKGHPISLLVTSESVAKASGGEEIPWEGLRFHSLSIHGWKVLIWSDNGLTYALVSDLEERGQASCIVCHQDERVFRGLKSPANRM